MLGNDVAREFARFLDGRAAIAPPIGIPTKTKDNEAELKLSPSVYAYLGRLFPLAKSHIVFCLNDVPPGYMSPFDTGGIVAHHEPVRSWSSDEKARYVSGYSFPTNRLKECLAQYPTSSGVAGYLAGGRPVHDGPHVLWPGLIHANLWAEPNNDWRAWTWEWRGATLNVGHLLVAWAASENVVTALEDIELDEEIWTKLREVDKLPMVER